VKSHIILYVTDQTVATEFYAAVLEKKPSLHVPGMTEFELSSTSILGLMPESGIRNLLGARHFAAGHDQRVPRSELYLHVPDVEAAYNRARAAGATELSKPQLRDWGHRVGYLLDPDGHMLAFARVESQASITVGGDAADPGGSRRGVVLRRAAPDDLRAMMLLISQLGHPASEEETGKRLVAISQDEEQALFVAEKVHVVGMLHVALSTTLTAGMLAEIRGLVVDESVRGLGIGTLLVMGGEKWAMTKGCTHMRVRMNVARTESGVFYEGRGYSLSKTQAVFEKNL
jgi:uncharacterized glyoxalase superfamily protein PhnB/N-acetylglutamate synthase-like GNAT family acetyltransferase